MRPKQIKTPKKKTLKLLNERLLVFQVFVNNLTDKPLLMLSFADRKINLATDVSGITISTIFKKKRTLHPTLDAFYRNPNEYRAKWILKINCCFCYHPSPSNVTQEKLVLTTIHKLLQYIITSNNQLTKKVLAYCANVRCQYTFLIMS